ncbi:MAG TPA: hypothetical protein ENG31_01235 [Candidatus Thorarchaeota archaeon]|nr:MAG: hypothetical protein DRO73_07645 [Candidatus Thorarchaeota archaeon]RLI61049.1 MAG: hypothetical protein DRO93_05365 [Candidatus Thorarchaeota archaeon]HDD67229.1 hypothetical protein [Candidatus Thorarchaeota archaeon]
MGVRGKLAWALKIDKVSKPIFQATYRELMNILIQTSDNVEEINQKMKDIGFKVGEDLLMEYTEKIRKHASTFVEFSSTLQLAYKVNSGQEFTDVWVSDDGRVVKFTDDHCVLCEGVEIRDMPGLQYCNLVSGVFQAVMDLRGFNAEAYQESCRALGDSTCTWTIRLRD